jgi:hypothetical protein
MYHSLAGASSPGQLMTMRAGGAHRHQLRKPTSRGKFAVSAPRAGRIRLETGATEGRSGFEQSKQGLLELH